MNRMKLLLLAAAAAFALTACEPAANTAVNNAAANANANANANRAATAAAPSKDELMTLERSAYDAWKNKNTGFWDTFLAANFVGYGSRGKLDKSAAMKEFSGQDCDVKSYSLSDDQMKQLGPDAAMVTYKVTVDGTCGGQKLPANSWAAGVYVRDGGKWKGAFHSESPIRDPNAPPAKPAAPASKPAANASPAASPAAAAPDANTDAMFALEKKAWDAWKAKDSKTIEDWASSDLVAFTSNGRQDRAGAIKTWMEDGCQVNSTSLTDPSSVSLGPDYALLLFKSTIDGKCGGSPVPPEYGATIYGKEAGAWKAVFTMGTPAE